MKFRFCPRRRGCRGLTLPEVMISTFIMFVVSAAVIQLTMTGNAAVARQSREKGLEGHARSALDEMLREVRAADQIFISRGINGVTYMTDSQNLVFEAPGFNPGSTMGILPGIYDVVALRYNAQNRTLTETTFVDTGSQRPRRSQTVLARNVESVTYTYRVRDLFTGNGAQTIFPLNARSTGTPRVYINGQRVTTGFSYSNGTIPGKVTFSVAPALDADVQFLYEVDPTHDSGKWLAYVNGVDVAIIMSQVSGGRRLGNPVKLSGNARMRNQRT